MTRASQDLATWRTMRGRGSGLGVCLLLLAAPAPAHAQGSREVQVVQQALRHVPGPVAPVVVIDPELTPDPRALYSLDAFVVREVDGSVRRRIYVNARSELLRSAVNGSRLSLAVLAAVLHHEMQHLEGRSELQARAAERELFVRLVQDGVVARHEGRQFLERFDRQAAPPEHEGTPAASDPPRPP